MSRVMRKQTFCICKNKDADQLRGKRFTAKLISAFVFLTRIVQSLFFPNPKFQASSHLLWLYSRVCVGPGKKYPPENRFSHNEVHISLRHCIILLFYSYEHYNFRMKSDTCIVTLRKHAYVIHCNFSRHQK